MSNENDGLTPWETALRMWASEQPGFPHAWFLVSAVKCLIDRGLLRPVEGLASLRPEDWVPQDRGLDAAETEIKALRARDAEITDRVVAAFCAAWAEAKQ